MITAVNVESLLIVLCFRSMLQGELGGLVTQVITLKEDFMRVIMIGGFEQVGGAGEGLRVSLVNQGSEPQSWCGGVK